VVVKVVVEGALDVVVVVVVPCEATCSKPEESELSDMIGMLRLVCVGLELDGSVETTVMKLFESLLWAHNLER
jgi:hypothetical protein